MLVFLSQVYDFFPRYTRGPKFPENFQWPKGLHSALVFGMFLDKIPKRHIFDSMADMTVSTVTALSVTLARSIDADLLESNKSDTRHLGLPVCSLHCR